jgi:hypothetical protein
MAKKIKAKAPKSVETKDLEPKDVKDVKGGRTTGGTQQQYLKVEFEEVKVSSYQVGGSAQGDVVP